MATARSLYDVLYATLFQIIGMATQGKGKHLWHVLHALQQGGDHNPYETPAKMGMVSRG